MKIGKNTSFLLTLFFVISAIIAIISIISSNSLKNYINDDYAMTEKKLKYSDNILDNIFSSSNLIKDMIIATDNVQRNSLLSQVNMMNSSAILYGDSLRAKLTENDELEMYNNYLEYQKQFLTVLTSINDNLNAGNIIGASNLNSSEFKAIADKYYKNMKEIKNYYVEQLNDTVNSMYNSSNLLFYFQLIILFVSLIGGLLSYLIYKTEYKNYIQNVASIKMNAHTPPPPTSTENTSNFSGNPVDSSDINDTNKSEN